ncbi:hypothetical protein J5N97_016882 [Dioscorea zingiberensis]|uniref:Uncharacterized protein n=1 Tax=Dioscorea zingiberensis TaxID=325984 RepID=A0A9D5CKU0_9LILI|nr:hypothetical protein J5N97_016882 [Dioscorea zingiberensis]
MNRAKVLQGKLSNHDEVFLRELLDKGHLSRKDQPNKGHLSTNVGIVSSCAIADVDAKERVLSSFSRCKAKQRAPPPSKPLSSVHIHPRFNPFLLLEIIYGR